MFNRVNFFKIIRDHFGTLNNINDTKNRMTLKDCFGFLILPAIFSYYLCTTSLDFHTNLSDLITCISILGGFLFNLLAIIYGLMDKLKRDAETKKDDLKSGNILKKIFIKQIHINISFNILLSIFLTLVLIIYPHIKCASYYINFSFRFLISFLLILFLLTLLMVLNRIYIILKKDVD